MTSQARIAAVVLTLNEENDIPNALRSLQWCNEIIVVDSGSSDSTQSLSRNLGARVYQHIQEPPFLISEQRNWALQNCDITSDWVIFLDADEEVGPALRVALQEELQLSNEYIGYYLAPRFWFLGRWLKLTQSYPNWHPRVVRHGQLFFKGGVWETFSSNDMLGNIKIPYEHYAFSKGLDQWLDRHKRYASWEAECIVKYLSSRKTSSLVSDRRLIMRTIGAELWYLRPFLTFLRKYVFNFGFLEGYPALLYALLISFYELMVVLKVYELKNTRLN